jgi:hypothetical protein
VVDNAGKIIGTFDKYLDAVNAQREAIKENVSIQHSVDITPEMRAEVERGLPLFSRKDPLRDKLDQIRRKMQDESDIPDEELRAFVEEFVDYIMDQYGEGVTVEDIVRELDSLPRITASNPNGEFTDAEAPGVFRYARRRFAEKKLAEEEARAEAEERRREEEERRRNAPPNVGGRVKKKQTPLSAEDEKAIMAILNKSVSAKEFPAYFAGNPVLKQQTAITQAAGQEREPFDADYVKAHLTDLAQISFLNAKQLETALGEDWMEKVVQFFEDNPNAGNIAQVSGLLNVISTIVYNRLQSERDGGRITRLKFMQGRIDRITNYVMRSASLALNERRLYRDFAKARPVEEILAEIILSDDERYAKSAVEEAMTQDFTNEDLNRDDEEPPAAPEPPPTPPTPPAPPAGGTTAGTSTPPTPPATPPAAGTTPTTPTPPTGGGKTGGGKTRTKKTTKPASTQVKNDLIERGKEVSNDDLQTLLQKLKDAKDALNGFKC